MIVTVCADKGSPGVSTTALLLGLVWPGSRLLLEADPAGGDAALRLRTPDGGLLARAPTLHALCVDARGGALPSPLAEYAQPTSLGLNVIAAADMRSEDMTLVAGQWPAVAKAAALWPGTVLADVGRLQADNPAGALAAVSAVVLLVGRADPVGLFHLRERAASLAARLGQESRGRSPLAVAVICPKGATKARLAEVRALLASEPVTCGVPVAGVIADDPRAVADLYAGVVTARLAHSDLLATARELAGALLAGWPALAAHAARSTDIRGEARPAAESAPRAEEVGSAVADEPRPVQSGPAVPAGSAGRHPSMTAGGWS